tara:strand:+ start:657 stop:905 length:249 start_codon:yes stop_codon:yes gene_type:complete
LPILNGAWANVFVKIGIKKFLKPTIHEVHPTSTGRHRSTSPAVVVLAGFAGFILALGPKPKFCILPHPELLKKAVLTSPKER